MILLFLLLLIILFLSSMCLNPHTKVITTGGVRELVTFPCGKCLECCAKYQNDWTIRLEAEYSQWKYAYFLTLTYSDENIPYVNLTDDYNVGIFSFLAEKIKNIPLSRSLSYHRSHPNSNNHYLIPDYISYGTKVPIVSKYDIQCWLKKIRVQWQRDNNTKDSLQFKYFLCSEYGPHTLRPHYHCIIFCNLPLDEFSSLFVNKWDKGDVRWKRKAIDFDITKGVSCVMSYVCKYCMKPAEFENPYVLAGFLPKPFRLMSHGIGWCYCWDVHERVYQVKQRYKGNMLGSYHGYNKDYIVDLDNAFRTLRGSFLYKVPRYCENACLPFKKVIYSRWVYNTKSKLCQLKEITRYEKSRFNSLCVALDNYRQDMYFERIDKIIKAAVPDFDNRLDVEACSAASAAILEDYRSRYIEKVKSFNKFYSKGYHYAGGD